MKNIVLEPLGNVSGTGYPTAPAYIVGHDYGGAPAVVERLGNINIYSYTGNGIYISSGNGAEVIGLELLDDDPAATTATVAINMALRTGTHRGSAKVAVTVARSFVSEVDSREYSVSTNQNRPMTDILIEDLTIDRSGSGPLYLWLDMGWKPNSYGRNDQLIRYVSVVQNTAPLIDTSVMPFSGRTAATQDWSFSWAGEPNRSISIATGAGGVVEVEAPAPEFVDNVEEGGGGYYVPENIEGVSYSHATGPAEPGETVTITATALDGYEIIGANSWTHTFPNAPDPDTIWVVAPAPQWTVNTNEGGGSWTTQSVTGVSYSPASGVAEPGETVTVTATALDGYGISGKSSWTYTFPDGPVEPEPSPELVDMAANVAKLLGVDQSDEELYSVVTSSTELVTMMVYNYTRGNGFRVIEGVVTPAKPDLMAVITSASSRLAANPSGLRYRAGTETVSDAFSGWTLAEKFVLDSYRKRWA